MEKAKDALILFIKSLPQDTYFNVVSFGTNFEFLFLKVCFSEETVNTQEYTQLVWGMAVRRS